SSLDTHPSASVLVAPTQHWRWKYSVGVNEKRERRSSSLNGVILFSSSDSMPINVGAIQLTPCSVNTSCRFGWRSRMPEKMKKYRGRCTQIWHSIDQSSHASKLSLP